MQDRTGFGSFAARLLALASLACGLAWGAPASAVPDFRFETGFDDDAFGWTVLTAYSQLAWSEDADPEPSSGAAVVTVKPTTPPLVGWPHDYVLTCFPIDPSRTYEVGGWLRIPTGQASEGSAQLSIFFYPNASCVGVPELRSTFALRTPGDWTWVGDPGLVPPPGSMGARVGLAAFKNAPDVAFEAEFDDVLFTPEPGAAALGTACLAVLMGAAHASRRRATRRA